MQKSVKRLLLGALVLTMNNGFSEAGQKDYAMLQKVTTKVVTPHFSWAEKSPFRDKSLLFAVPYNNGREIVELWQRMPFKYESVLCGVSRRHRVIAFAESTDSIWPRTRTYREASEKSIPHVTARLNAFLDQKPEVMVTSGQIWKFLPEDVKENILEYVQNGMGLAVFQPGKDLNKLLAEKRFGKPEKIVQKEFDLAFLKKTAVREWKYGKGRIITVKYPRKMQARCFLPHASDYYTGQGYKDGKILPGCEYETVIANILSIIKLAGNFSATPEISKIEAASKMDWRKSSPGKVKITVNADASGGAKLKISVMDTDFRPEAVIEKDIELKKGENEISIPLPSLPCGRTTFAVQLEKSGMVISFGAAETKIVSASSVSVKPEKAIFAADLPVAFTVKVKERKPGDKLAMSLTDYYGRVTERIDAPVKAASEQFTFNDTAPLSKAQTITCKLIRDGKVLAVAEKEVLRDIKPVPGKFYMLGWGGIQTNTPLTRHYVEVQKNLGRNMAFFANTAAQYAKVASRVNMDSFTLTLSGTRDLNKLCDKKFLENQIKKTADKVKEAEAFGGSVAYSYGDELYIRGWDPKYRDIFKEPAKTAFVNYLKKKYGNDIGKLNKSWGTDFKSFADFIIPKDIDIPKEPRAPWLDYCQFMVNVASSYYNALADAVHAECPGVSVGFDGLEQFSCFDGIDLYEYQRKNDNLVLYKHIDYSNKQYSWRAGADFKKPGTFGGMWLAYGSDLLPEVAGTFPWQSLFLGMNSILYFQFYEFSEMHAAFYPDYRPRPAFEATARESRRIIDGIDKLVLGSKRTHSPIAVHYSPRSFALSFPESGIKDHINRLGNFDIHNIYYKEYRGNVSTSASAFLFLMNDAGYQTRMLATPEIEAGDLKNYKVLFLPFSQCLTNNEAEEIRKFVKNGGLLITDYGCGIRDENGNKRSDGGVLDDVFGIVQKNLKGSKQPLIISEYFRIPKKRSMVMGCKLDETVIGGDLELKKKNLTLKWANGKVIPQVPSSAVGAAKDGTPVMVTSFYGKGMAIYLNFSLDPYMRLRRFGKEIPLRRMISEIVNSGGGVPAPVEINLAESGPGPGISNFNPPESGVETTVFKDGKLEYAGMVWDYKRPDWKPHKDVIFFLSPAYTYDVINGKYLGFTDRVETEAGAGSVRLYARLPYRVEKLNVTAPQKAEPGEKTVIDVKIKTANGKAPGRHVVRMGVTGPGGKELKAFRVAKNTVNGKVAFGWIPALNDPPGIYIFAFRDIATGVKNRVKINLEKASGKTSLTMNR